MTAGLTVLARQLSLAVLALLLVALAVDAVRQVDPAVTAASHSCAVQVPPAVVEVQPAAGLRSPEAVRHHVAFERAVSVAPLSATAVRQTVSAPGSAVAVTTVLVEPAQQVPVVV